MGKRSTRLKISFFSLLLAGFIVIQYCWLVSMHKDKSEAFKYRIISAINGAGQQIQSNPLAKATITRLLHQTFSSIGLGSVRFEYSINSAGYYLTSQGFQQLTENASYLTLNYVFNKKETSEDVLTVAIPSWSKLIWKQMIWPTAAAVLLTIMIVVIFYYASLMGVRNQQLFYDNRTKLIKNMMQQFEAPLSTMSVAAEALRNARVMQDAGKINYYQRVINEENKRMNEQVEKFLRELK